MTTTTPAVPLPAGAEFADTTDLPSRWDVAYWFAQAQAPDDPKGLWADFALHYSRSPQCRRLTVTQAWERWE